MASHLRHVHHRETAYGAAPSHDMRQRPHPSILQSPRETDRPQHLNCPEYPVLPGIDPWPPEEGAQPTAARRTHRERHRGEREASDTDARPSCMWLAVPLSGAVWLMHEVDITDGDKGIDTPLCTVFERLWAGLGRTVSPTAAAPIRARDKPELRRCGSTTSVAPPRRSRGSQRYTRVQPFPLAQVSRSSVVKISSGT